MRKRTELRALALEDVAEFGVVAAIEDAPERHDLDPAEIKVYTDEATNVAEGLRRQARRLFGRAERLGEDIEECGYRIQRGRFFGILGSIRDRQLADGEQTPMTEERLRDYLFHYAPPNDPSHQDWLSNVGPGDAAAEILDYIAGRV